MTVQRVAPEEVRERVVRGTALLVCAYDDDAKFRAMALEGAIPMSAFLARARSLPKDQEIVFYCA